MTKSKLNALLFSMDEYRLVRDWAERNKAVFDVDMPFGLATAPLARVIYESDLLSATADGILIANHYGYSREQIADVCRILGQHNKGLYAVTNGVEPMGGQTGRKELPPPPVRFANTAIVKVLNDCRSTLRWLNQFGPTEKIPKKLEKDLAKLERLGFVFRRNKSFSLRRQRLLKVLQRESKVLNVPCRFADLLQPQTERTGRMASRK